MFETGEFGAKIVEMPSRRFLVVPVMVTVVFTFAVPRRGYSVPAGRPCDLNGDGYEELVVGAPMERIASVDSGIIHVVNGSSSGLTIEGNQIWHRGVSGVAGAHAEDAFGSSLACGNFNNDAFGDLAVGAPGDAFGELEDAGSVHIFYGSASGITADDDQIWTQGSPGIPGAAEQQDRFGYSLAAGDYNGDSYADLAISSSEAVGVNEYAGAVHIVYGSQGGLSSAGSNMFTQDSPGILGFAEPNDAFGRALGAADLNGDEIDDLAIGAPNEAIGIIEFAGAVHILYGTDAGLASFGNAVLHQNTVGVLGQAEDQDGFGQSVAAGDFDGDGFGDIVVGVANEDLGSTADAGMAAVLYGSPAGISTVDDQAWTQDSQGVAGAAEQNDNFGWSVAAADFNGDGLIDAAIGGREAVGSILGAGAVNVLLGTENGIGSNGNEIWHQDTQGILGQAESNDNLGYYLGTGDFNGDAKMDLAATARREAIGLVPFAGAVNVIYGSPTGLVVVGNQIWHQGLLEAPEEADLFGTLAGSP